MSWFNPQKPYTGDGKTRRDIYGGKENTDNNALTGIIKVVFRNKDGKPTK